MKRTFRFVIISVALSVSAPCFAQQEHVVLDLKSAKHYQAKSVGEVYIQADRFLRKSNAVHYSKVVGSETKYPVQVVRYQGYYYVTVGPMHSASAVRKVAAKLKYDPGLTAPKMPTKSKRYTAPTKSVKKQTKPGKQVKKVKEVARVKPLEQIKQVDQAQLDEQTRQADQARLDAQAKQVEQTRLEGQAKLDELALKVQHPEQASNNAKPQTSSSYMHDLVKGYSDGNWIVTAGAGVNYPNFSSSMTINNNSGAPAPFNQDIYTTKSRTQILAALSVGYRWERDNAWLPAFSANLSYQHLFSRNVGGTVIQYSDPEFTNYDYDWAVSSDILMALLKVNIYEYKMVSPYLLGGMGTAINSTSNYSEGALSGVSPRTNPAFDSNSTTSFAYRVGAGLDFEIDPQVILSAEYQYQGIGNIASQHGAGSWSGQLLNLGSYKSNALLLNVTYLFDNAK